eukprot:TRINITY_DN1778_c0_g1_i2.p1 TRINITY_DN1778_c0_g1~~TRINITY_DN1778_c0_g1_i2.p1  ORF type:complete len:173 (-),score=22.01 TRINITY_DN1778_c0_g1_i2:784-1302(-)
MKAIHTLLTFTYLVSLFLLVNGQIKYPDPMIHPNACSRETKSFICDPDRIISYPVANNINSLISDFANQTIACDQSRGYQIAVALVERMSDYGLKGGTPANNAEQFAKHVHGSWGVGYQDCQSGVVLFLARSDRQMYISTGIIAMERLTNSIAANIIENMKPHLRNGDYKLN